MKKYGLLGYPLKHSFSQRFFTEKFERESIDAQYLNFEIPDIADISRIIESNEDLIGLNVTLPYKEKVIPFLNELDESAERIGAVNVIKINRDNSIIRLKGYNTDIIGFQDSLAKLIDPRLHKKALILGTGGASKAVYRGLINLGVEPVYVSRTPAGNVYTYSDLDKEIIDEYKIIVNTSPLGTFPDTGQAPDIPYRFLSDEHLLYDLVYNPAETKFLRLGREKGATIKNGAEMLELQALAAWGIWNQD